MNTMNTMNINTMDTLRNQAKDLLSTGRIHVLIGYGEGSEKRIRALFIQNPAETDRLIADHRCTQNLGVYLMKPEVRALGKMGIVATLPVMRTVLQLASEHQLSDENVAVLGILENGTVRAFDNLQAVEEVVQQQYIELSPTEQAELDALDHKTMDERWAYWQEKLSACFKCYACRAACPMCYCTRCTVECNQPQWIPAASHQLGNLEWHMMRAMHLAGRCIECGECNRACPLNIPVHLLSRKLAAEIRKDFNNRAGVSLKPENTLSTFKPDDKENFIG
ncbi:MAG: hypothetical protein ACM3SY_17780 [Candidatus Omnitrophota bacterium]